MRRDRRSCLGCCYTIGLLILQRCVLCLSDTYRIGIDGGFTLRYAAVFRLTMIVAHVDSSGISNREATSDDVMDSLLDRAISIDDLGFKMFKHAVGDRKFAMGDNSTCAVTAKYSVYVCDTNDVDTNTACGCEEGQLVQVKHVFGVDIEAPMDPTDQSKVRLCCSAWKTFLAFIASSVINTSLRQQNKLGDSL